MHHIAMIAQPIQRIPPTGAAAVEWWMWQVAKHLASSGRYTPHIICTGENDPSPTYEVREGVHFYRITLSRTYKRLFQKWTRLDPYGYAARAARYCREINAKIIHTHNSPHLHQQISTKLPGTSTVLHMHNEKIPSADLKTDLLLTVSHYLADWYAKFLPQTPSRIITNGIDRRRYLQPSSPVSWRAAIPEGRKILMYAGRISPEKGVHLLTQAFIHLAPHHPEIHLVIIGGRNYGDNDRAHYADELEASLQPFSQQVTFVGSVTPEEMDQHYRAADLLVIPSVFEEPFGMVCLEGMAAGVPVLAAPKGGLPEFVKDAENGYLIKEHGNPKALAAQIENLLQTQDTTKIAADHGRVYALEHHDWSIVAARLAEIYEELLNDDLR